MNTKLWLILGASLLSLFLATAYGHRTKMQTQELLVRIAELDVDPAQLGKYQTLLKEEIEDSIRLEAGVLNLFAVAEKENPAHIRIFEMYANEQAYKDHLETQHFKKYKIGTQAMVKSLKLIETTPILLGAKAK